MTDFTPITPTHWATLPDDDIAKRLGCSPRTVTREREKRELPKVRKKGSGRPRNPHRFDLTKSNLWNAERMGITRQRAGQIRKQLTEDDGL